MYAQITIVGNVGQDPELRYTPSSTPMCTFSVAVNRAWTNTAGEQQQKVTWYSIVAFQRQAEVCAEHIKQGDRVLVVSENVESVGWVDGNGNVRTKIQLVPRTVRFLSPRSRHDAPDEISADVTDGGVSDENPFK
jgi:single-strand DNA-binding protein